MRFQCSENSDGRRACNKIALTGEEYCQWHLNIRNLQKEVGNWGKFMAYFCAVLGYACGLAVLTDLWSFARTPTAQLMLEVVVLILSCIFLLSYALIFLGKRYALCVQLIAGAMGGSGCIFILLGCVELIGLYLGTQSIVSVKYFKEMPRMLSILTDFGMGIYMLLACLNLCSGLQITRLVQRIVIMGYILAVICMTVFNEDPGLGILILLILTGFYLDRRYKWIKKLLGF
jgi:hypothetical protein